MRSLCHCKTYQKNTASLLEGDYVNKRGLDLCKEVLWVSVGQRTVELQAFKVRDLTKNPATRPWPYSNQLALIRVLDDGIMLKV